MDIINKNMKKTGFFNAALILIALAMEISQISKLTVVEFIAAVVSLCFGAFYMLGGYKKESAFYFKAYMFMYLITALSSVVFSAKHALSISAFGFNLVTLFTALNVIIAVCLAILAIKKDLGVKKSSNIALIVLTINALKIILNLILGDLGFICVEVANFVLAIILLIFISAKYTDKEARGTK